MSEFDYNKVLTECKTTAEGGIDAIDFVRHLVRQRRKHLIATDPCAYNAIEALKATERELYEQGADLEDWAEQQEANHENE